jgi:hypothetical protein
MRSDLPSGTVTFVFTDVEASTRLLHDLGAKAYGEALAGHRRVIREACAVEGGVEVDTQGDVFFFAFPTAAGALAAASALTDALAPGPIRVRVGLHTGMPLLTDEGYVGDDVHLAARIAASAHGGQVVCSAASAQLVDRGLTDLGEHRFKDVEGAVSIFQLGDGRFPPLNTISNRNLPRPASSFVGREIELGEVLARIEEGARLVTLTGPGGTGKTRLALEAASTLVPAYRAGVFWVGLASVREPALVTETIAQAVGAPGLARNPHRRAGAAPPPRQPRAGDRRRRRALHAAGGLPQPHPPRHEPRAPAHPGRGGVPRPAARRAGGRRPLLQPCAARTER